MRVSESVANAQSKNAPVVALESTIITHGLPYPRNLETALALEATVEAHGAMPATIAVIDGVLRIGLDRSELEALGVAEDVRKLSRADFASALVQGSTGSTTVAATMIAARLAGIETFATGGIGGVHRGAEDSFDISADLQELAQTPVAVICAGAKAILDIPKTLEVLETLGVPVTTIGQSVFPAFWSRASAHGSPARADTTREIAETITMRRALGLSGGHLIANPIPEADEIPSATMIPLIEQAIAEAEAQGIDGPRVTPFLLARIFELTQGASLEANIALVLNNARLGTRLAGDLAQLAGNE